MKVKFWSNLPMADHHFCHITNLTTNLPKTNKKKKEKDNNIYKSTRRNYELKIYINYMRWAQVSCLNCRLTNSCLHVVVFLSDEIFLSVFFGGKKIKCPRPVAVIRSTLCWAASCLPLARPRLFFFVSLEIIFFWVLFLQHLFFSDWLTSLFFR